jgi:hypothetical protein
VSFTPCQQSELKNDCEEANKLDVESTYESIRITHYNFEVSCDFTDISVTHTLENGILSITQQGYPNQTNCICYTDVSYIINGLSLYASLYVNAIVINGTQYCYNENDILIPCNCVIETMKGEWCWIKTSGGFSGTTMNAEFESKLKILGQNEDSSVSYEVIVEDTLFHRDNFHLRQVRGFNYANIELPHHNYNLGYWGIYFGGMGISSTSKDILIFWGGDIDGYYYVYVRIRKE